MCNSLTFSWRLPTYVIFWPVVFSTEWPSGTTRDLKKVTCTVWLDVDFVVFAVVGKKYGRKLLFDSRGNYIRCCSFRSYFCSSILSSIAVCYSRRYLIIWPLAKRSLWRKAILFLDNFYVAFLTVFRTCEKGFRTCID